MAMDLDTSESDANLSRWTDDQELTLLKAVVRYKPVGMHKHFRMLAIRDFMLNSGNVNPDVDTHVSIPGIWAKLKSLYDLEKLDEREDSVAADGVDDAGKVVEYWRDFELPGGDFEAKMWERRLAPDGSHSPDGADTRERRESTVMDSEDPASSPVDPGSAKGSTARGTRSGRKPGGGRLAEMRDDAKHEGRSSRRTSKAATPAEDEDQEMQDAEKDEEEDDSEEDEDGSEREETEDDRRGSTRSKGRGGQRGRPRRGRRRG